MTNCRFRVSVMLSVMLFFNQCSGMFIAKKLLPIILVKTAPVISSRVWPFLKSTIRVTMPTWPLVFTCLYNWAKNRKISRDLQDLKNDTRAIRADTQQLKQDARALKEGMSCVKEDTQVLREDAQLLKEGVDQVKEDTYELKQETQRLLKESEEIKSGVTQVQDELGDFADETSSNFKNMHIDIESARVHVLQELADKDNALREFIATHEEAMKKELQDVGEHLSNKLAAMREVLQTLATKQEIEILKQLMCKVDKKINTLKEDIISRIAVFEEKQALFLQRQFQDSEIKNQKRFKDIKAIVDANGEIIRNVDTKYTKIYNVVCMIEKKTLIN